MTGDPKTDPYYLNGFDQLTGVAAYDAINKMLYLGIRVRGIIGDTDGDGTPDNGTAGVGGCSSQKTVVDGAGVDRSEQ